jgi:adenine-specific DNA methylase
MIPHSMLNDQLVSLVWISNTELHIKIKWPSFLSKLSKHVAFQKNEAATNQFGSQHEVFKLMTNYLVEIADHDKKCIIDTIVFKFKAPMDMENGTSEVLDVTLTDTDLEDGETLPPGNKIKVHQLVLQQAIAEEDKPKTIKTTKWNVGTGKQIE